MQYPVFKEQKLRFWLLVRVTAWQRPTLPAPCGASTIGAGGLNGRVRDGYAWFPSAIITKRLLKEACSFKTDNERTSVL